MITKIMKHDFLALRKPLGITVGLTLLTAILSAIAVSILRTPVGVTIFLLAFLGMLALSLIHI